MFRFSRELILPLFLARQMTVYELSKLAKVSYKATQKAVSGGKVTATVISRIGKALGIDFDEQPKFICEGV